MSASVANERWFKPLPSRLAAHLLTKSVGIPLFFCVFFVTYFHLLRHPQFPVTVMPLTWLDRWTLFHPAAVVPYVSLWVYVLLPPSFIRGRREMVTYLSAVGLITLVGLGVYFFWPTATPPLVLDASRPTALTLLKSVDASGNAFPSLHVAFAVFSGVWIARMLRHAGAPSMARAANVAWCGAIVYSTLATGQHVVVDVLGGVALGAAGALLDPIRVRGTDTAPCTWLNRQTLALAVSIFGKLTLFALDLPHTHPVAAAVLFLAPDLWIFAGLLIPNLPVLVPTVHQFATAEREVWLTIDDGPTPQTTRAMLDLLARHQAKATFFVIGERVAAHPELITAITEAGHTIGNHTHSHPLATFWLAGARRTAREVDRCAAAIEAAGGKRPVIFRPPAGIKTFFLRSALARRGLVLVGWTARGREHGCKTIATPLARLLGAIRPGAILLVHESSTFSKQRIALLDALLKNLAARGFRCVLPAHDQLIS